MIELSTTTLLTLYLFITLAALLSLWASQHLRKRNKKIIIQEKELLVCEFCHFCYLHTKGKALSRCPQCNSYNSKTPE